VAATGVGHVHAAIATAGHCREDGEYLLGADMSLGADLFPSITAIEGSEQLEPVPTRLAVVFVEWHGNFS
jgi:hypothetical protein